MVNMEFYSPGCCSGVVWARKHRWWAQACLCIFSAWYPDRGCGCRTLAHRLYFCWWWCLCVWWESVWPVGNWHRSGRGTFWIRFTYKFPLSKYVTDSNMLLYIRLWMVGVAIICLFRFGSALQMLMSRVIWVNWKIKYTKVQSANAV